MLDGTQARGRFGQGDGGARVVHVGVLAFQGFLGTLLGFFRLGAVHILGALGGVRQHGDQFRLDFQEAAGDVEHFFVPVLLLHANRAGLEPGEQGRVTGHDTQVPFHTGGHYQLDQSGEQLLFGTNDIAMHGHRHLCSSPGGYLSPRLL